MNGKVVEGDSTSIVIKGVTIFGVGGVAIRVVDLIIAVLILRWLTIFEFGLYKLVLSTQDLFSGFFLSGLDNVVVSDVSRDLQKKTHEAKSLYTAYFVLIASIGFLLWILFFFGSGALFSRFGISEEYAKIVSFVFLISPLETILNLRFSIFLDFGWSIAYRIMRDIFRLGLLVVFLVYFSLGINGTLWSLVLAKVLPVVITLVFYRRGSLLRFPAIYEIRDSMRTLFLKHGKWALLDDFTMNTGKNIMPFIIKYFSGVEAVALFAVAQNLLAHCASLFPIRDVLTPVFPRIADSTDQLISKMDRSIKYSVWIHLIIGVVSAMGIPVFVYLLFPKYIPSVPLFYILLLGLPWTGIRSVLLPVFYALRQQKILFNLTIFRLLLISGLSIILTYFFGVWGAAYASLLMGIILTKSFIIALGRVLPGWRFLSNNLLIFDRYDRDFIRNLRNVFLGRLGLGTVSRNS